MITVEEALQRGAGEWRSFTCPVHDDHNPSARVNVNTRKWVCMSCGAKGKAEGVEIDVDQSVRYIQSLLSKQEHTYSDQSLDLYDIDGPGPYWPTRFSLVACREFRLGQDGEFPTYPIRDSAGRLLGVVRRNPYNDRPKYILPKGVNASELLFGIERAVPGDPILVVEGAPDVVAAWEAGFTAVGSYGSNLFPRQISQIAALSPSFVGVAYDDDRAGRIGLEEAVPALLEAGLLAAPVDLGGYHDIAEIPVSERADVIASALDGKATIDYLLSRAG